MRFQRENIAYRRRPRRRHPECIYDVSHFLWRAGAFAANKKRTREKWRERAWATPRAKRKVKAGKGERHRSFVMSKSIVLAALAEESLISKWGGILLPLPPVPPSPSGFADVGPLFIPTRRARGIKRDGTTTKVEEQDEEESPSSYFVDASAVSCSGGFPNRAAAVAVRAVLLFSPSPPFTVSLSLSLSLTPLSLSPAPSRRVATRLLRSRDPPRQISSVLSITGRLFRRGSK